MLLRVVLVLLVREVPVVSMVAVSFVALVLVRLARLLVAASKGEVGSSSNLIGAFLFRLFDCLLGIVVMALGNVRECFFLSKMSLLPPFHP